MPADHLHPNARAALELSVKERKYFVSSMKWYGYPQATKALAVLESAFVQPPKRRTKHIALTGETNNGKSSIIDEFMRLKGFPFLSGNPMPVLYAIAPTEADERRLWTVLLVALGGAFSSREAPESLFQRLRVLMHNRGVRMVVIDEFQDTFHGTAAKQHQLLACIKRLGNDEEIPIVLCGTRDLAGFLRLVPQVGNRFSRFDLPTWSENTEFQDLLENFESGLPLPEASGLWMPGLMEVVYELTGGFVGEVADLSALAAIKAIDDDLMKIDEELLRSLEWIPPHQRR